MNKVLIVDDSLMIREVFSIYLQEAGFEVMKAASVEEASETLKHEHPNLIVLDIVMEGKSGFEFCYQLKKQQDTKSIPVILCSTKTTEADKLLGSFIGADAYLHKTIKQEEFVAQVRQLTAA